MSQVLALDEVEQCALDPFESAVLDAAAKLAAASAAHAQALVDLAAARDVHDVKLQLAQAEYDAAVAARLSMATKIATRRGAKTTSVDASGSVVVDA